jgi:hypothetical protein
VIARRKLLTSQGKFLKPKLKKHSCKKVSRSLARFHDDR